MEGRVGKSGMPKSGHLSGHSDSAQPPTTVISLQDMEPAPDDGQSWQPSSLKLREPVLDFPEKMD